MSRNLGTFNDAANFEMLVKAPLDAKQLVPTYADLTAPSSWTGSGTVWLYDGAIVAVGADPIPANNGIYWLKDASTYTSTSSWVKAGGTIGALTGATNGLRIFGSNVELGGSLTGDTYITGSHNFGLDVSSINLTGATVNIGGIVKLHTTPSAGTTSDSVIVWNASDKMLKVVGGSSLGDKNNIYSQTIITGATLLTTGSTYLILVNNTGTTTVTLPATPINGQAIKIKDVSGNACLKNITISGNGKNIETSSTALIDTNNGAVEIVFDTLLNKWFGLSAIN